MVRHVLVLTTVLCMLVSCEKTEPSATFPAPSVPEVDTAFYLNLVHTFNNQPLRFNSNYLLNVNLLKQDTIQINTFKYYLTNISLQQSDSSWLTLGETYYLVDHALPKSMKIKLTAPAGTYTSVRFLIGVDSARNVSGVQDGSLDPALGMFWTWVSGYIQAKLEGKVINRPNAVAPFIHHIGGFSGPYNPLQWIQLRFDKPVEYTADASKSITISADTEKWFTGSQSISPLQYPVIMDPGAECKMISENYRHMFSFVASE
ncbi:MAG: MbnP family protein [Bacteroidota bacterium]|jgi:hypothetical protein